MSTVDPLARCAHFPDDLIARCGSLGRVLEIGMGGGFDAARFCARGADYVGIDLSASSIALTSDRLRGFGMKGALRAVDFHEFEPAGAFQLVYDRGVFHNQKSEVERDAFVHKCAAHLAHGGCWISVIGSADNVATAPHGSFYLSNVILTVERYFEVIVIDRRLYGPDDWPDNFDAWYCLFRKRASLDQTICTAD